MMNKLKKTKYYQDVCRVENGIEIYPLLWTDHCGRGRYVGGNDVRICNCDHPERCDSLLDVANEYESMVFSYGNFWVLRVIGSLFRLVCSQVWLEGQNPLEASIEKWSAIVAFLTYTSQEVETFNCGHSWTCGLCNNYLMGQYCGECPVAQRTERYLCAGTPYEEFNKASGKTKLLAAAKAELKFLKGLK